MTPDQLPAGLRVKALEWNFLDDIREWIAGELRRRSDFPGDSCGKCDRIAELERENARKDALLRECRGHLRGHKMSMLAYTTERLIAAIDAAIKENHAD